jgi:hypothetical protein
MQTHAFLGKIEQAITPAGRYFFDDIRRHHTVVSANVFRAVGSDHDPAMRIDSLRSAAVAIKSLSICIMAFDELARLYPEIFRECKEFREIASDIKQAARESFTSSTSGA